MAISSNRTFKLFIFFFITLFVLSITILYTTGITLSSVKTEYATIDKINIKLDKKFVVTIDKLMINIASNSNQNRSSYQEITSLISLFNAIIQKVSIKQLFINKEEVEIKLEDELLTLKYQMHLKQKKIALELKMLLLNLKV